MSKNMLLREKHDIDMSMDNRIKTNLFMSFQVFVFIIANVVTILEDHKRSCLFF